MAVSSCKSSEMKGSRFPTSTRSPFATDSDGDSARATRYHYVSSPHAPGEVHANVCSPSMPRRSLSSLPRFSSPMRCSYKLFRRTSLSNRFPRRFYKTRGPEAERRLFIVRISYCFSFWVGSYPFLSWFLNTRSSVTLRFSLRSSRAYLARSRPPSIAFHGCLSVSSNGKLLWRYQFFTHSFMMFAFFFDVVPFVVSVDSR